jgi:hypothetical protein
MGTRKVNSIESGDLLVLATTALDSSMFIDSAFISIVSCAKELKDRKSDNTAKVFFIRWLLS